MSGVTDKDTGYRKFMATMAKMKGAHVKVGVQAGPHRDNDGGTTDMVLVAAANEFGTEDGHVPERSFLRSTYEGEKANLVKISAGEQAAIARGSRTPETSLALMGTYLQGRIQAKIHSHPPPENAPATIAKKGSSGTLVDTGQLAQSIRYEVVPGANRG